MAEPPVKRARLEGEAPVHVDAPGSPVDDFDDDDFYETPQLDDAGHAKSETVTSSSAAAAPAQSSNDASALIPGLGAWSHSAESKAPAPAPTESKPVLNPPALDAGADEDMEDGEVSDTDVFYGGQGPGAQASATAIEDASQHSKPLPL